MQSYADLLSQYLDRPGLKQSDVAQKAQVDPGTITKLKKGQGTTRDTLIRVAAALDLPGPEQDRLLVAAQYLPVSLAAASEDVLELVLRLARWLTTPSLPAGERQTVQQFLEVFLHLAQPVPTTSSGQRTTLAGQPLDSL